jgi:hypothetical protein
MVRASRSGQVTRKAVPVRSHRPAVGTHRAVALAGQARREARGAPSDRNRQRHFVPRAHRVLVAPAADQLPPWETVYWHFKRWRDDGSLDALHNTLRGKVRAEVSKLACSRSIWC